MNLRGSSSIVVGQLAAACCVFALLSCNRSPSGPTVTSPPSTASGQLLVYVSTNGIGPAPGKTIELKDTSLSQSTDENGQALFTVRAGTYVVRAFDIGTPGPSRPYVEQTVVVETARTSRAQFNDCTMCR